VIEQRPVEVEAHRTHSRHRASLEVDRWPIVHRAAFSYADPMEARIRFIQPADADLIEQIESDADRLLTDRLDPEQWPAPPFSKMNAWRNPASCSSSRRRTGRELLDAPTEHAQERGYGQISLGTYADVPGNAPL
jgi:hypothetical protein